MEALNIMFHLIGLARATGQASDAWWTLYRMDNPARYSVEWVVMATQVSGALAFAGIDTTYGVVNLKAEWYCTAA